MILRRYVPGPEKTVCPNQTCRHREASIVCSICKADKMSEARPCFLYRDEVCTCTGQCVRVAAA
jgi:hypothetical protein